MKGIKILGTGRALPSNIVTNDDLSKIVDTNDEWIVSRTGIRERRISQNEKNYELAAQAAKRAMEQAQVKPEEIGAVIVATITPDYVTPSTACMVQHTLGLPTDVMAFDLNAACSGFLYGMRVARGLFETLTKPYVLLIGSEQLSRILDFTDRSTCVLFGDGAGAAVLGASQEHLYYQQAWSNGDTDALSCPGPGHEKAFLQMDGQAVFKFAVKVVKEGIDAVLEESGLSLEDIDYVLCHQANERIIDYVKKKYKAPDEQFYLNLSHYGNTSAASIPIALDEMNEQGLLQPGKKMILVGFGAGFTWSSVLISL